MLPWPRNPAKNPGFTPPPGVNSGAAALPDSRNVSEVLHPFGLRAKYR